MDLGNGRWIIIDSCKPTLSSTDPPIALIYLEKMGIDPKNVSDIFISHWHDDHIKGIAEIVATCQHSNVFVPSAFTHSHFSEMIGPKKPGRSAPPREIEPLVGPVCRPWGTVLHRSCR